jgi:hypothetical protein
MRDAKWRCTGLVATRCLTAGIPSRKGDKVTNKTASKPEIPMCHSGKYQILTPKEVKILQYTNPR